MVPAWLRRRDDGRLPVSVYLLVGTVFILATGIVGPLQSLSTAIVAVFAIVGIAVGIRRHRPSLRWPWAALWTSLVLAFLAALARTELNSSGTLSQLATGHSLVPDLIALPAYFLFMASLIGFARARAKGPHQAFGMFLDGAMAGLSFMAWAWVYAVVPLLERHHGSFADKVLVLPFPPIDVFLLVMAARLAFGPGQRKAKSYRYLLIALACLLTGDVVFMTGDLGIFDPSAALLSVPYAFAYLMAVALALDPSMRTLTEPNQYEGADRSPGRVVLIAIALVTPAVLLLQDRVYSWADRIVLVLIASALTISACIRMVQAIILAERSREQLFFQAYHDTLTGLPNRRSLERRLTASLEKAIVDDTHVALLFLDLDRFKLVNDTLGHTHGDELLVSVATRLSENMRPSDLVTRIGGDEFMIVLGNVVSVSQALDLANRLRACLRDPFLIDETEFYVTASIGLAFATGEDRLANAETLIRDADTAMYKAKEAGRDSIAVFDESMRAQLAQRVELEKDLRFAVEREEMHLVYQPILQAPSGPVRGVEALIRWGHPTLGVLSPQKFIPLAEESDLIITIGSWVLEEALRQLAVWRESPIASELTMSVNLSAVQLRDELLVPRVAQALDATGLPGSALCLELTESAIMDDPEAAVLVLQSLRNLGVRLSIDDFGTEYSSLAYLRRFPVDCLKVDRSFVIELDKEDSSSETLVAAIIAMARALGIETVAEGVETPAQARRLLALGCNAFQGYLYSRPVRAAELLDVMGFLSHAESRLAEPVGTTAAAV